MCWQPCCVPASPVRTLQRCPRIRASVEGLGVEDHLRLIRCSRSLCRPRELLRGWISTCSCPSWMRPTCPDRGKRGIGYAHTHTHTHLKPQQPEGSKTTSGLFLYRLLQLSKPKNEPLCNLTHPPLQLCWGGEHKVGGAIAPIFQAPLQRRCITLLFNKKETLF